MKKILRLVTTSVLTLTLVACGEASSSVASSTPASSSVSSPVTSTFAAVTRIDLSAATDSLTQVLGAQKAVVVTATLSANANPATPVEWFVDGAKSNQTGRVFEFTPAKAGTFVISARVGSVNSTSTVSVVVGVPAFKVETAKFTDNKTIEIKAPAGASVAVTGNELLAESRYDIVKGTYFLNLKTALKQGDSATVTFTTESGTVTEVVTFDTRAIDIDVTGGAKDNKDGTYTIVRPHELNASTKVLNTVNNTYTVTFQSTNLGGTQLPYKLEQVSVPTGATAIAVSEGLINVATTAKANANSLTFNVTRETIVGSYVFKYTLNGISKNVTLIVEDTEAEIKLAELQNGTTGFNFGTFVSSTATANGTNDVFAIFATEADIVKTNAATTAASTAKFNFLYKPGLQVGLVGVVPNADGEFEITKDYLPTATAFKEFAFKLSGNTFRVPTNLRDQAGVLPNQALISVSGPGGSPLMRTQYKEQLSLPVLGSGFRDSFDLPVVKQRVDASTPVGKYTYTLRILQLGVEIMREEVVVVVKAPTQESTIVATLSDAGEAFKVATKVDFAPRLERIKSAFPAAVSSFAASTLAAGSDAGVTAFGKARTAYLRFLLNELPAPTLISAFNYENYIKARDLWVTSVTNSSTGKIKFAGGATVLANFDTQGEWDTNVRDTNTAQLKLVLEAFGAFGANPVAEAITGTTAISAADVFDATGSATDHDAVVTAVITSLSTFLNVTPDFEDIDTQPEFDAQLAIFKTNVAKLYPSYEEFVNSGLTSSDFKVGADGIYEIEKPFELANDSKSLVFNLNLVNFESPINAGATIPNSYLNGSTKRELLPYIRTVSGPVLLPNHSLNNVTTKIAIELDSSESASQLNDTIQTQEQPTPSTYARYRAATHSTSVAAEVVATKVTVPNVAIIDVDFLTPTGVYTYNVSLGSISKTISVRVVNAKPVLNFGLVSTDGIVLDSDSNGGDSTVKQFVYNSTDDKYYATLGVDPTTEPNDRIGFYLQLSINNVKPGTTGLTYTFTKTTPLTTVTRTDVVAMTAVATTVSVNGNDGVFKLTTEGTTETTAGAIANLISNPTTFQDIRVAGTYIFDLTLGDQRKVITLVVNKYPTLKDVVVNVGTTKADVFGTRALIPSSALAFNIAAASDGLPSGTLYYTLGIGTTATSGLIANNRSGVAIASGVITDTEVFRPLNVATIPVQLVTDGSSSSAFDFATNADLLNKVRFIQVNIFQRVNVTGFNPLVPRYDLIHVGHRTVEIWYGPNNIPVSIISTAVLNANPLRSKVNFVVTTDTIGRMYYLLVPTAAKTPTLTDLIQVGSQASATYLDTDGSTALTPVIDGTAAITAVGAQSGIELTPLTVGTVYKVHYVVVGNSNVSNVVTVEFTAGAQAPALTILTTGAVADVSTASGGGGTFTAPTKTLDANTLNYVKTADQTPTAADIKLDVFDKISSGQMTLADLKTLLDADTSETLTFSTTAPTLADADDEDFVIAVETNADGKVVAYQIISTSAINSAA